MLIIGFHRTLSSATAQWLHRAGLCMGHHLLPPHASNPDGHYEDWPLVKMHDRLLKAQGTDWLFFAERERFRPDVNIALLRRYCERRNASDGPDWGAKDPRLCLFLPAWRQVLGENGRYLVLLRHWSASLQSLLKRHSQLIAQDEGRAQVHGKLWQQADQLADMWLGYHQNILQLLREQGPQCLCISQKALKSGLPLIQEVNRKWAMNLNEDCPSPIRSGLSEDRVHRLLLDLISPKQEEAMETLWADLLALANIRTEQESPEWVDEPPAQDANIAAELRRQADNGPSRKSSEAEEDASIVPALNLMQALRQATANTDETFDAEHWIQRIESESQHPIPPWEMVLNAMFERGRHLEIEKLILKQRLEKPRPYLLMLLAKCREADLNDGAAEALFKRALAKNPKNPFFQAAYGLFLHALGRSGEAAERLTHWYRTEKRSPPLLIRSLATIMADRGEVPAAIELLQEQETLPPGLKSLLDSYCAQAKPEQAKLRIREKAREKRQQEAKDKRIKILLDSLPADANRRDLALRISWFWDSLSDAAAPH